PASGGPLLPQGGSSHGAGLPTRQRRRTRCTDRKDRRQGMSEPVGGRDEERPGDPSGGLAQVDPSTDPIELFGRWYEEAVAAGEKLPDAMALATATPEAVPSVRMVLLKGVGEEGFSFFTNYESRKASELDRNPRAALCFHWVEVDRQVRVTGTVRRVSEEESRTYFVTRPRGSRIGAWASRQSRVLRSE